MGFFSFPIWIACSSAKLYVQVFLAQVNLVLWLAFSEIGVSDGFIANGAVMQVLVS
jgi:hypothetical protein